MTNPNSAETGNTGQTNAGRVRDAYRQWHETKGGSVDAWLEICDPQITFISSGAGNKGFEFAEPCSCLDDVRRYFSQLDQDWEMLHFTVDNIIGDGDDVVMHGSTAWRHRKTGLEFEVLKADVWKFKQDKAVQIIEHFDAGPATRAIEAAG